MTTFFAILLKCWELNIDMHEKLPKLWETSRAVYGHFLQLPSQEDEAVYSMKVSQRGQIRRAYNVIEIVLMLQQMGMTESGLTLFVRKHNMGAAKADQIVGTKAVALKFLWSECRIAVLEMILAHVSLMGFEESTWTLQTLSNKKMFKNYQFPSKSKKWVARVKTSDESMESLVIRMHTTWESLPEHMRFKAMDVPGQDALSERAAVLHAAKKELQLSFPIADDIIQKAWIAPWEQGSDQIDKEIQVVVMDKSDSFEPGTHLATLKALVDQHAMNTPLCGLDAQKEALDVDKFNLIMRQVKYDEIAAEIWIQKCSTAKSAQFFKKQDFRLEQKNLAKKEARAFMDGAMSISVWDDLPETNIAMLMDYRKDVCRKLVTEMVPQLFFLNRTSPCLVSQKVQDNQISVLTWGLHENMQSAGLVLDPVFTYSKSKLHLEKASVISQLTKGNHNLDHSFFLTFKDKCDERDGRPMTYPGTFVFPSPLGDPSKNMFFQSDLRKLGRTAEIAQIKPKDMKEIEDLRFL